ncbi:hypothetical protein SAMN05660477_00707 [Soonwooa buanensis]|uniref:Uncharacterized protein n=1 Tax=Soonwooa buanensis TaxID=619805 RepID=A0A1T5DGZ5_9FLAO|nr:hypothetical protein [Soonwooa buanensis]SKB70760.1 hypothetical protein SAMN05660477_00707 [Soonwooa buanensis]
MIKKTLLILSLIIFGHSYFAQTKPTGNDELDYILYYKRLVDAADSIKTHKKTVEFDSKKLFEETKKLDKENYPGAYIAKANDYYKKGKYNESGFLYYLTQLRAADFNASTLGHFNNDETANMLEESSYLFLSADVANYHRVLKMAIDYYEKEPYTYLVKYDKTYKKQPVVERYCELLELLETKDPKVIAEIQDGRQEMIKRINEYYEASKSAFEK